jgi:Zn-dependent protease
MQTLQGLTVWILPVLFAVTMREAVRGYVALACGDTTAKRLERLSLNPLNHIDPFGSIVLPALTYFAGGFVFGYAKPIPVNFTALRRPRFDSILICLAAFGTSILLAAISILLLLHLTPVVPRLAQAWAFQNFQNSISINLILAVFNMLPIPPLDGGRILIALLPRSLSRELSKVEGFGTLVLLALLVFIPMLGNQLHRDFNFLAPIIAYPANWLGNLLFNLLG